MRLARMWKSKSPGVETAVCFSPRISRKGCSIAGRGEPKSLSHASDPMLMMQERPASRSRISTARKIPLRSPQNDRTVARVCGSGLRVTTRNIAARLSGAATGLSQGRHALRGISCVFRIGFHRIQSWGLTEFRGAKYRSLTRRLSGKGYHRLPTNVYNSPDFCDSTLEVQRSSQPSRNPARWRPFTMYGHCLIVFQISSE